MRRQVLQTLASAEGPVSAYDLMDRVEWGERKPVPMQVYRALDFLMGIGLAHKIATLSAFVLCRTPDACSLSHFLICRRCQRVDEVVDAATQDAVQALAGAQGFRPDGLVVELTGLCQPCWAEQTPPSSPTP